MRTSAFRITFSGPIVFGVLIALLAIPASTILAGPATGSLTVKIKPKEAKQDGARWRVDGGAWHKGGDTESGLSEGGHTVTYKDIAGWKSPKAKDVTITANQDTTITGKYRQPSNNTQTIMLPGDVPMDFVWIPAGSFMMGRYTNEQDSNSDESPQHTVTFANGFWMGKYEVSQAQWVAVMGNNPSYFTVNLSRPVEQVSWNTIQTFITAVNALGQGTVHLPTEAQWEYACRAGTTTRFYWGDDASYTQIGSYAWYYDNSSSGTHSVGLKLPDAWGLYDMSGNVWEWCEDWYHSSYTGAPTDGSAWVSPTGSNRVIRGGGWGSYYGCRSAGRNYYGPSDTNSGIGFRLAR
ncbi:MAG: formylglycine-generating enzyme family protein [Candidatus Hydrogenedentes bacterium]|nr:formylglycine-generating enzyme family protein [Candidatus Hydrogenedentota bacterium]